MFQDKTSIYLYGFDGRFIDSAEMPVNPGELSAVLGPLHRREGEEEPENNF